MTTDAAATRAIATAAALDDFEAEQADLESLLRSLADDEWPLPTPAAGWDVRDQVAHLADTEEVARGTATGGARNLNEEAAQYATAEDYTQSGVLKGRAMTPAQVLDWWTGAAREHRAALRSHDPDERVPWGFGMSLRAFAAARIMEHWAHGLDIRAAVGRPGIDTDRLVQVAWISARAVPYGLRFVGVSAPDGRTLRFELTGPDCTFGPPDATDAVRGPTGQWCRLAVQRLSLDQAADLTAEGPLAELALRHAGAFL